MSKWVCAMVERVNMTSYFVELIGSLEIGQVDNVVHQNKRCVYRTLIYAGKHRQLQMRNGNFIEIKLRNCANAYICTKYLIIGVYVCRV